MFLASMLAFLSFCCLRACLHRLTDQYRALELFFAGMTGIAILTGAIITAAQLTVGVSMQMDAATFSMFLAALSTLFIFCWVMCYPFGYCVLLTAIIAFVHVLIPPTSNLGHVYEPLLITGAMLLGHTLGYLVERWRRAAYLRTRAATPPTASELAAPAVLPAERMHWLTLRFDDGHAEREYSVQAFQGAYSVFIFALSVTCALVILPFMFARGPPMPIYVLLGTNGAGSPATPPTLPQRRDRGGAWGSCQGRTQA